jgi:methyl-accepting chemotaxis protein
MFVVDQSGNFWAILFQAIFPKGCFRTRTVEPRPHGIEAISFGDESAYDITYPVKNGVSRIGVVHVGLSKGYIDEIISRLRITFLGFISVIIIIFFGMAHWLSGYITRPMGELIRRAEEISRGNLEVEPAGSRKVAWKKGIAAMKSNNWPMPSIT